ncbi:Methionine--tRNA ligase [Bacillus sp. THAF10]|uniref:methionine--tRNA ligase n=1 Tax=Bacillus sp. THAF10 TaxID=2587848 RepID=UPI0012681B04|nr:methionine--tRNA ligase [Bacillus sp. THAF10]QFT89088.1 Methionine--tRNA ligase [Bacillus sp. THAF10]
MNIFIGGAWVYANGSLHIGHIASLLPGDILARYYRQKGENVLYVSGSDCNGTPIAVKARKEGVKASSIANRYHQEFLECFNKLGFSYDVYSRTDSHQHHEVVQKTIIDLYDAGYLYPKEVEQIFCVGCQQFLPDRFVVGICPVCKSSARGDQCDNCSTILDPLDLENRCCSLCGERPAVKMTKHLYFALSQFQQHVETLVEKAQKNGSWRENALSLTKRYLKERLHDRAVTRDLPIGVQVPVKGFEDKKIYVWVEAVIGYLSAAKMNEKFDAFWNEETVSYYVHGKDNIPFHTIIWPAILHASQQHTAPAHIVSNEYITLEKKKVSTSNNWAVWIPEFLEVYDPDSLRYFLTINAPEKKDADFSWREFIYSHNSELLGAYGNFVNRTFKFIEKSYDGHLKVKKPSVDLESEITALFFDVGILIENAQFKLALEKIFYYIRKANKFFDTKEPWKQIKENDAFCQQTLWECSFIIVNIATLLTPFLPFSSEKVFQMVGITPVKWGVQEMTDLKLTNVSPLFQRIDDQHVQHELQKLADKQS